MILNNKIAVVTGASAGLGAAISKCLTEKNVLVYGLGRTLETLEKVHQHCGTKFMPIVLDIADEKAVNNWVQQNFEENKAPDILINNAGIGGFGNIDEMPSAQWVAMINTNLLGMYFMTAAIVPFLKTKTTSTHIINIGSIMGTVGKEAATAYASSKFAVQGFSDSLFKELRVFDIKVSCVNPGSIATDFFQKSGIESHGNMLHAEDVAQTIMHLLETPDNVLIDNITLRPLNPKKTL